MADRRSLRRPIDVLERIVGSVLVLLAAAAALAALMIGSSVQGQVGEQVRRDVANSTRVTAELVEATPIILSQTGGTTAQQKVVAAVRWTTPDGTARDGETGVDPGLPAGAAVTVWLDRAGRPTHAPPTASDAVLYGIAAGVTAAVLAGSVLGLCWWSVRRLVIAVNCRRWAEEWAAVEPQWRRELR